MHQMKDLSWHRNQLLKTVNCLLVPIQANENHASVVEIAQDIHGFGVLLEGSDLVLDNWQSVDVALRLQAQLSEFPVQGVYLLWSVLDFQNSISQSLDSIDSCSLVAINFLSDEVVAVLLPKVVDLGHLVRHGLQIELREELRRVPSQRLELNLLVGGVEKGASHPKVHQTVLLGIEQPQNSHGVFRLKNFKLAYVASHHIVSQLKEFVDIFGFTLPLCKVLDENLDFVHL